MEEMQLMGAREAGKILGVNANTKQAEGFGGQGFYRWRMECRFSAAFEEWASLSSSSPSINSPKCS